MLPEGIKRAFRLRRKLGKQVAEDVDAELRFHLEERIEALVAEGRSRREAEGLAVAEFGDVGRATRVLRRESGGTERAARRAEWLGDLAQDLRFGWRKLLGQPGFSAVAILTLALGIGANTAVFSVVHAVLLRPLPYPAPERLVSVWEVSPTGDDHNVVSRGNYMDWRDEAESFEELGAYGTGGQATLRVRGDDPVAIVLASVTPSALSTLGVTAHVGRVFAEEDGVPGGEAVALLSFGLWQIRFGGDPEVVGEILDIDNRDRTVVGVLPPGFDFPSDGVEAWVPWPLGEQDRQSRRSHNLRVVGRLAPGVTVAGAQAEMTGLASRASEAYPEYMKDWGANVQPFRADLVASTRPLLVMLMGVVGLVLLLACANLANLLLARALAREGEVAVRGALGASRGRLMRQFVTEAGLIAFLGGAVGFAVAATGLDLFVTLAPPDIPLLDDTRIDMTIFGFAGGVTLVATLLFGLVPALRAAATDLQSTIRVAGSGGEGVSHARLRSGLLVVEVALAVVLLIGAGLLLRTAWSLQSQDYGFEPEGLITMTMNLPRTRYPNGTEDHVLFYGALIERLRGLPGVVSAAGSTDLPAGSGSMTFSFAIEGRPRPGPNPRMDPQPLRVVTNDYFETLKISLVEGRYFTEDDDADAPPVVIVNEALADLHWPGESPMGKRISFDGAEGPWLEIVGVVGNTRHYAVDAAPGPALYLPHAQKRWDWTSWLNIIVRTQGEASSLAPALQAARQEQDRGLGVGRIATLVDLYAETNARRRFATLLLLGFAGVAVLLGTVGVYGVLSYSVARRRPELGIRIALGEGRRELASRVVLDGVKLALVGAAVGTAAALVLTRFLGGLVYGITATDPATFAGVPLLLVGVAAVAAFLPALRATRVDPVEALRAE